MTNDSAEDFDDANADLGIESGAPLAAPAPAARAASAAPGSRKGLLAGLLVVVAAGLGGGYYYLSEMADAPLPPPPPPSHKEAAAPVLPLVSAQANPAPTPAAAVPLASPVQASDVPPPSTVPGSAPAAAAPVLAQANAPQVPAQAAAALPVSAPENKSADAATPQPAAAAPVNAATASPALAAGAPTAEEEAEAPGLLPAPVNTTQAGTPPPPPARDPASAAGKMADLPLPSDEKPPPMPAADAGKAAGAATGKTPAAADKTAAKGGGKADPAEQALVDNAPILDKISAPNDAALKRAAEVEAQQAIVRPLPGKYLVVRKNSNAGTVDERLTAARGALGAGNNQAALALFDELRQKHPKDSRILMGRALALQGLGQGDAALAAYEDVLTREPKNLEALTNMLGLLKGQDPKLALDKLKELRNDYPGSSDITAQLGIAYGVAGDYPQAVKYLDMAEALQPGNAYVAYNKAVLYDKMGNSVQAAALYRDILSRASEGDLDLQLPLDAIRARLAALR